MWISLGIFYYLGLGNLFSFCLSCPSQCSCTFYSRSDPPSNLREVLCNDPEMTLTPVNIPVDTFKLRIEKTSIRQVQGEAFRLLTNLEFLWMPYNSVESMSMLTLRGLHQLQELRLDGNDLTSFPWESLTYTPRLRLLDLHNNELSAIPKDAARFMKNITYLDISSNKLMTLPQELIASWLNLHSASYFSSGYSTVILGLQDNPWQCDCSLYEMVHFLNFHSPSVAFIEPQLQCASPQSLSGIPFSQVELRKCQSPVIQASAAKLKTMVGSTVLLRCGTMGVPVPELSWRRTDGIQINGTVHQEISSEGMSWSMITVPNVSYKDSGEYICKAKNNVGMTEAFISVLVTDSNTTDEQNDKGTILPTVVTSNIQQYRKDSSKDVLSNEVQHFNPNPGVGLVPDSKDPNNIIPLLPTTLPETERLVRGVKVIGDTDHSVSLAWKAPLAKNNTVFSVLYAIFGERDMRRISVEPGKTKITIDGLMPQTKYIACVSVKGLIPKKEQCIIFSTDEAASAGGTQKLINVVVISVACVIAVPLTLVVCCGALKRRCTKGFGRRSKDIQDSYVTFESLAVTPKTKGADGEYLTRHTPDESNRLLSPRSSVDSEAITKAGQANEFFC
ncbi:leucine-rich repeat, immunoglobulin-like domain and transmembrane domain-containing protein 1 [Xenopus tropicalis]|uniref:leucine-rich repeat, immunoglobulin-like domain and transmembrane domain-containing protein 1 n=1 Tax=Xenopus tropicalis TaxID=8364 RepID=UPI00034F9426|nr:leucine-rich repeat, immunoglobulin-like domain and transmembrane domain-containing protein 1 [Xenopus tropicalis]|eukprot:XP_002933950.2 PREDICTED: leucine-rich repeat, immunoglobulin-like domain and transmembrane domain-containing protein 1 [Xenopus tropicalis]